MRTSSAAGSDIWDALEGLREAVVSRHTGRPESTPDEVRAAVLSALSLEPKNGHQVMETIAAQSGGAWTPGASAVYPTLQLLTDEGLVRTANDGERTVYTLTDAGRAVAAETAGTAPGQTHPRWRDSAAAVPRAGAKLAQAAAQVVQNGSREQQERAAAILDDTRRKLYAILAED